MMSFFAEFKDFARRGNVVDMAVGVIIGVSFGKIITSLVNDVLMPPIGLLLGGVDFSHLKLDLGGTSSVKYGVFINTVIDFLIVAVVIFLVLKGINSLKKPPTVTVVSTKDCPECCSSIAIKAKRCAHCTAVQP